MEHYNKRRESVGDDEPPYSRLFILGSKQVDEEDIRNAFSPFGHIKEVKAVRDRNTGEYKGIFYVKYTKTSDAAKALENMKGHTLCGRNLKVLIASKREQGSVRDENEDYVKRLFVVVPKTATENEVYDYFKQFGDLEYASILKNKETKESKGFAYVKFVLFSDAAKAFEDCDRKYKPVFAEPRRPKEDINMQHQQQKPFSSMDTPPFREQGGPFSSPMFKEDGVYALSVVVNQNVNQDQVWKLFDIVPSLDYCQLRYDLEDRDHRNRVPTSTFDVVYTNYEWAAYAAKKFHGFEYPPGHRLIVKFDNRSQPPTRSQNASNFPTKRTATSLNEPSTSNFGGADKSELIKLAETIAQANSLIKAAGLAPDLLKSQLGSILPDNKNSENYCSVDLPEPKPLLHIDTNAEARCFVICTPVVLSSNVLRDIFCRFGDLIDVYMLANKNYGFAKFASKESAEAAIKVLHGADVLGTRLKVFEAEERPEKKPRIDEHDPTSWHPVPASISSQTLKYPQPVLPQCISKLYKFS